MYFAKQSKENLVYSVPFLKKRTKHRRKWLSVLRFLFQYLSFCFVMLMLRKRKRKYKYRLKCLPSCLIYTNV